MKFNRIYIQILDFIVLFGRLLRQSENKTPFQNWQKVILIYIPQTFFIFWLFSLIPIIGTLSYALVFIPLSAWQHIKIKKINRKNDRIAVFLLYFVVIYIGFGRIWGFIGHTFLADSIATGIGWPTGSPFQTELAFYTLGFGIAGIMAIWLRGHMITALIISKSIFWYGAAFVHIKDAIVNNNYSPLNIGMPLIGDIILPTILLTLLVILLKNEIKNTDFLL